MSTRGPLLLRIVTAVLLAIGVTLASPAALAQIKSPGSHPDYAVELEPHLIWQFGSTRGFDDGLGLGLRASIPVIKNGPVPSINNNFAIGVGLDWTHFDQDCFGYYGFAGVAGDVGNCYANHFIIPVVAQWNFFFTPVVSAYTELGFAIHHYSEHFDCRVNGIAGIPANVCGNINYSHNGTNVIPMFTPGVRFLLSDAFALGVRFGYPYLTLNASFLL